MSARYLPSMLVAAIALEAAPLRAANEPRAFVGRVVDAQGVPLAGVLVEYGHYFDGPDKRESTTTNAVGRYRLVTTTVGRDFRLGFSAKGFAPQWIENVIPGPADQPKRLDVQLVAGTRVTVEFRNRAGQPVPGIRASIGTPSNGFISSFSHPPPSTDLPGPARQWAADAAGQITLDDLPPKPLEVHRWQGGESHNWLQLNIRAGNGGYYTNNITEEAVLGAEPVVITLPDWQLPRDPATLRGIVRARVVDALTGRPIPRYLATLRFRPQPLAVDDADGLVACGGKLEIGNDYQLRVFAPGYAVIDAKLRAVSPEEAAAPPEIRLEPHPSLEGRLVDAATNKPLAGVMIVAGHAPEKAFKYIEWSNLDQYADGHHSLINVVRVTTDAQGRFTVPEAPDQPTNLIVLHPGYARRVFPQTERPAAGDDGVMTFALRPASRITAAAIRQTPAGAAATRVSLGFGDLGDGFDHFGISAALDDDGRATFDSLPAATYRLTLEQGRLWDQAPSFSRSVSLAAGQHKTILLGAMPGALRLYGKAPPLANITVTPKFETEFGSFAIQADADGRFELTHLLPGQYGIRVNDASAMSGFIPDEPEITVDLQQDSELDLLTRARRKVLGR